MALRSEKGWKFGSSEAAVQQVFFEISGLEISKSSRVKSQFISGQIYEYDNFMKIRLNCRAFSRFLAKFQSRSY